MKYTVLMNVWVNNPDKDDGAVGGSSIVSIFDDQGNKIDPDSDEGQYALVGVLSVLYPQSFKRR